MVQIQSNSPAPARRGSWNHMATDRHHNATPTALNAVTSCTTSPAPSGNPPPIFVLQLSLAKSEGAVGYETLWEVTAPV